MSRFGEGVNGGKKSRVWKFRALAYVEDLWPSREDTTDALTIEDCSKMYSIEL
jgi:hypothetical protein